VAAGIGARDDGGHVLPREQRKDERPSGLQFVAADTHGRANRHVH